MATQDIHPPAAKRRRTPRVAVPPTLDPPRPMPLPESRQKLAIAPRPHGHPSGELVKLHHALIATSSEGAGIITQFVAPERDTAITRVVYDLAYVGASWLGKRVLYVNGAEMRMDANEPRRSAREEPRLAAGFDAAALERDITRVVGLELYQLNFPSMRGALDLAPALREIPEFLGRLRQAFDLVVIAAPSAAEAPLGVLLSPYVDGNVLVLAAGRTRVPVAEELRRSLRASGGAVVGAVLTGYRSFAPRWLRRWL